MFKKAKTETGVSEIAEATAPDPASTEPVAEDGYVRIKREDWEEMLRNLKMAR